MLNKLALSATALSAFLMPILAQAQENPSAGSSSPAAVVDKAGGATGSAFAGYVPSASPGMRVGGADAIETGSIPETARTARQSMPPLSDGRQSSPEKVEGFNAAIEQNFPMTPEMIRQYKKIFRENQEALLERKEPKARVDAGFISLEPGEDPPELTVSPGLASAVGFYDVTGEPWPVTKYVIGSGEDFQVEQMGENNLAISPMTSVGFSNLMVMLKDQPRPVILRVSISNRDTQYRYDLQIMDRGPNAVENTATGATAIQEAGDTTLLSFLSGAGIPEEAAQVPVYGISNVSGWLLGDRLFLRSRHPLMSPRWLASMSGPDEVRVYEINRSSTALFSVNGQFTRANIRLP